MISRPKPGETDEDILKLQDEFLKQKDSAQSAVKLDVLYKNPAKTTADNQGDTATIKGNVLENLSGQSTTSFETIPTLQIGSIKEKCQPENHKDVVQIESFSKSGFPIARKYNKTDGNGKGSIFAQQMKKKVKTKHTISKDVYTNTNMNKFGSQYTKNVNAAVEMNISTSQDRKSSAVSAGSSTDLKREIHEQNLSLISNMSQEEIENERQKYISSLDPALIAFIKSRKKSYEIENKPNQDNINIEKKTEDLSLTDMETPFQIVNEASSYNWLGFDKMEVDKLAWLKDVDVPTLKKSKQFEARFDFKGWLMPYCLEQIDESNRILYHHGEEPGRPGYTLQELFHLSRSTVLQQKVIALNCIANILHLYSLGIYKDIIDIPIEQIFFVVRFCLDDNSPGVLSASIKAMHNLIYFNTDEVALDIVLTYGLGKIQPMLSVDDDAQDDYTANDQQIIESNVIRCMVRSNILTRIRYIIKTIKPLPEDVCNCLEILIRLARDSNYLVQKIFDCDDLLQSIVNHFLCFNVEYGKLNPSLNIPTTAAIKLMRVLASRQKSVALELVKRYHIMDSIIALLINEEYLTSTNGLKVQIECFHLWTVMIHYKIALEDFEKLKPIIMRLLHYYIDNVNADQEKIYVTHYHLASLLVLLAQLFTSNPSSTFAYLSIIATCFRKWISQFIDRNVTNFAVLSALFSCFSSMPVQNTPFSAPLEEMILNMLKSSRFHLITDENLINGSMLLNNYEQNVPNKNLKTLQTSLWDTSEHVIPIIQSKNCIPLLTTMSHCILNSKNNQLMLAFLNHDNIKGYISKLESVPELSLVNNWFTNIENELLLTIFQMSITVKSGEIDLKRTYNLTMKCLPIFDSRQKASVRYVFKNIIFNRIFCKDNLDVSTNINETSVHNMLETYLEVLNLKDDNPDFNSSLTLDVKIGNLVPADWMYFPLVKLYAKSLDKNGVEVPQNDELLVKNSLKWIVIVEKSFPDVISRITVTEKFCRLACIFLAHDNMFLDPEVHDLLEENYSLLMSRHGEINFDKKIEGLAGFEDFYKLLLEQYQAVSYGNSLFGNIILLPLAQKYNVKWRKILWSEYIGVVQTLNLSENQLMFKMDALLVPPEQDMSLIACYKRALSGNLVRKNSVLYTIVSSHLQRFVNRNT